MISASANGAASAGLSESLGADGKNQTQFLQSQQASYKTTNLGGPTITNIEVDGSAVVTTDDK